MFNKKEFLSLQTEINCLNHIKDFLKNLNYKYLDGEHSEELILLVIQSG